MSALSPGTVVTLALVPLIAWRVYVRVRRAIGRQRVSRYRGPISLTIYGLLIGAVTFANLRHPSHLVAFALAVAAGAALATYVFSYTKFEPTPHGLYYTPHGPIGIALAILLLVRLVYRLVEVYVTTPAATRTATEFAQSPLTLCAFGLLAGYYAWYMLRLVRWRSRVLRAKREREASRGDA